MSIRVKMEWRKPSVWRSGKRKRNAERECRLDGNIGINWLGATLASLGRCPGIDGVLTDPQGDVTATAQRLVILTPIFHAIRRLIFWMSVGSFVGLGHGAPPLAVGVDHVQTMTSGSTGVKSTSGICAPTPVTARPMTRKEQRRFKQWKNR